MAQDFDVALKLIFARKNAEIVRGLAGEPVSRWLSSELPEIRNQRADLIGETESGQIVHIEFQSGNAGDLPVRMAQYYAAIYRKFRRYPLQVVLYVGEEKLRMPTHFSTPAMKHRYRVVDLRTLDGEAYLASHEVRDRILALLMRLRNRPGAIQRILDGIAELDAAEAVVALDTLLVLSGLRGMEVQIEEEIRRMPILGSRLDNKVLGREFKKGLEQGLEQGLERGLEKGEAKLLRRLLLHRFKRLPAWAETRLEGASPEQIEAWGLRFADAKTLREVFDPNR